MLQVLARRQSGRWALQGAGQAARGWSEGKAVSPMVPLLQMFHFLQALFIVLYNHLSV